MPPRWIRITEMSGSHPRPRHGHRAVVIKELIVVFGGGNCGLMDELYVFNAEKNHWFQPAVKGKIPCGRAAFGMIVDKTRIIMFGGMTEYGQYSSEMFELQASRWEWKQLNPNPPRDNKPLPLPRLGHTFTLIGNKVFLFGGLAMDDFTSNKSFLYPRYLNDLYTLELDSNDSVSWDIPTTFGSPPSPRESHSAIAHQGSDGHYRLIIYGGMSGSRLGDLWLLDVDALTWKQIETLGTLPYPRSLHTATLLGDKMYVFGGWVPLLPGDPKLTTNEKEWKVTNQLACLDLTTFEWNILSGNSPEEMPKARAGHCAVVMNGRIYVWSGRDGYRKAWNNQVCCSDFWYLELCPPSAVGRPLLIKGEINSLELSWTPLPSVEYYLLQIQRYEPTVISKSIECPKSTPIVREKITENQKEKSAESEKFVSVITSSSLKLGEEMSSLTVRSSGSIRQPVPRSQILLQKPGTRPYTPLLIKTIRGKTYPVPQVQSGSLPLRGGSPLRAILKLAPPNDPVNPQSPNNATLFSNMLPRNTVPLNQSWPQSISNRTVVFNKPGIKLVTIKNENQIKLISSSRNGGESTGNGDEGIADSVNQMIKNTNQQAFQNVLVPLNEAMISSEALGKKPHLEASLTKSGPKIQKLSLPLKESKMTTNSNNTPYVCKEAEGGATYIQLQPGGNYSKEMMRALPSANLSPIPQEYNLKLIKNPLTVPMNPPPTPNTKVVVPKVPKSSGVSKKIELPISPSTIKIKRDPTGGAAISWEPLSAEYNVTQYTLFLIVRRDIESSGRKLVYTGSATQAFIPKSILEEAEVYASGESVLISFNISASNIHGTSQPMLIRWRLQTPISESNT